MDLQDKQDNMLQWSGLKILKSKNSNTQNAELHKKKDYVCLNKTESTAIRLCEAVLGHSSALS